MTSARAEKPCVLTVAAGVSRATSASAEKVQRQPLRCLVSREHGSTSIQTEKNTVERELISDCRGNLRT